jgi:CrcB protein
MKQQFFRLARHKMVWIMVGGAVGTLTRYWITQWFYSYPWGRTFPYATMFINVTGSFILGAAFVVFTKRLPPEYSSWYLAVGTGFCGGYTTFSTFELETFRLVEDGSWRLALYNVLGSVSAGFLAVVLAVTLVNAVWPEN